MKYFWKKLFKQSKLLPLPNLSLLIKDFVDLKKFKIIKIVGTNGKGSVSNFLAQGLIESKFKVGLFTSPHLVKANERIMINQQMIKDREFREIYKSIPYKKHFFVSMFLVALKYFEINNCDYIILEAGIGGTFDTTNAIYGNYGLVTSISLDHTKILGNTKTQIAKEKAGIICKNMNFIIPTLLGTKIVSIFQDEIKLKNAKENLIVIQGKNYFEQNKKLASFALSEWFKIDKKKFNPLLGRTEVTIHNNLKTYLDVAHNFTAVKESLKLMKNFDQVVLCFRKTKDVSKILSLFKGKTIFYYQPTKKFHKFSQMQKIKSILRFWKYQNKKTLYIGSFTLIGKIKKYEDKKHFKENKRKFNK